MAIDILRAVQEYVEYFEVINSCGELDGDIRVINGEPKFEKLSIDDLEQILSKMKELQRDVKSD